MISERMVKASIRSAKTKIKFSRAYLARGDIEKARYYTEWSFRIINGVIEAKKEVTQLQTDVSAN